MSSDTDAISRVTFVMSSAAPVLGMEVVAQSLLRELSKTLPVESVIGGGPIWGNEEYRELSLGSDLRGWRRVLLMPRFWKWSRKNKRAVVVIVGVWAAIPWLLARPRGRCIVWEHSLSSEKISTSRGLTFLARIVPLVYRRAWRIVCVSSSLAYDVSRLTGRNDIEVIPNVVEPAKGSVTRSGPRSWPPRRLLCVGSLTSTKRQRIAIEALSEIDESSVLTIAGAGPTHEQLAALAEELGVGDRVRFVGHVGRADVFRLMVESDVLLHPAAGETFGMVLLEAAQVSLPVLAVATRHSREFVPKFVPGQLFDGTTEDLVRQLNSHSALPTPSEVASAESSRADELATATIASRWIQLLCLATKASSR